MCMCRGAACASKITIGSRMHCQVGGSIWTSFEEDEPDSSYGGDSALGARQPAALGAE